MNGVFTHVPALDGIRGVAVTAVVLHHTSIIGWGPFFERMRPLEHFLIGGVAGVDIFFVLSGFLITSILLDEHREHGSISILNFYARRILRLYPALLVTIAFSAVLVILGKISMQPKMLLYALTYTSNFAWAFEEPAGLLRAFSLLVHTWSLAVEEQFYLIWPFLLGFLLRRSSHSGQFDPRHLLAIIVVMAIACFAFQWVSLFMADQYSGFKLATRSLVGRAGAILSGCATATIMAFPERFSEIRAVLTHWLVQLGGIVGLIILLGYFPSHGKHIVYNAIPISLVSAVLIGGLVNSHRVRTRLLLPSSIANFFAWQPLRYVGRISYGIYLYHVPVFFLFPAYWILEVSSPALAPVIIFSLPCLATIATAALSFHFVERPMLRMKDKFHRRKRMPAVQI